MMIRHSCSSVRRNAYLAAGLIGTNEMGVALSERYTMESDFVVRMAIVTALSRMKEKSESTRILSDLKEIETNDIAAQHLDFKLNRLEQGTE